MNKTELITEIINLCDRAEEAERLIERFEEPQKIIIGADGVGFDPMGAKYDGYIMAAGRKVVFEKTLYYWRDVEVHEDDETGVLTVETYEKWLKKAVRDVPDYFSRRDFLEYFGKELREEYEEKKSEALDAYKKENGE